MPLCFLLEQECLKVFRKDEFIRSEREIGTEYFSGNLTYIKQVINKIVNLHKNDFALIKINDQIKINTSPLHAILTEKFVFTYDDRDFVPYKEIENYIIDEKNIGMSPRKLAIFESEINS